MHSLSKMNAIVRYGNFWRTPKLADTGIGACDRPYLFYICHHPNISQDTLSDALFVNKSSVARRLAYLEKQGYVTRTPDEGDRRVLLVSPTQKALALLPLLREMSHEWNEIITRGFSEEELNVFSDLVARAYANAQQKVKELAK